MTIGGWHRLWIVLSAALLLAACLVGVQLFPDISSVEHSPNYYDAMSAEARNQLAPASSTDATDVRMPNGHVIHVLKGIEPKRSTPVLAEYESQLQDALRTKRVKFIVFLIGAWLGSCALVYGFGWSVGWVYRGFKCSEPRS